MKSIILVGLGGFLGTVVRFVITGWIHKLVPATLYPAGTLFVNILGCFFIGLIGGLTEFRAVLSPGARIFLMIGLLGGFTTFSSFGYESVNLLQDGEWIATILNTGLHVLLGFGCVILGYYLGR